MWWGSYLLLFFVLFYKTLLQHKVEQNCVCWWGGGKGSKVCNKNADWKATKNNKSHTGFIAFKINFVLQFKDDRVHL